MLEGSSRTGGFYYFEDNAQVDAQRVVILADTIEAMAYSIVNDPDCPTLYLAAHTGGWVPGDRLSNIPVVVVATDADLVNLPPVVKRHSPTGKSWADDLQALTDFAITDLAIPNLPDSAEIFAQIEMQQRLEHETTEKKTQAKNQKKKDGLSL